MPRIKVETRLPGWGGRTRTQESVRELCICDVVITPAGSAKTRHQRLFAFKLRGLADTQLGPRFRPKTIFAHSEVRIRPPRHIEPPSRDAVRPFVLATPCRNPSRTCIFFPPS